MKLFIPGPVEVREEILREMCRPPIGHRSPEFTALFTGVVAKLKKVLHTDNEVFVSTSSGSGFWETAARSCVKNKVLCCTCGAFSEKWAMVCEENGKKVATLESEWGSPNLPEALADALKKDDFDAVTYCHSETSTGMLNPLPQIGEVMKEHPDILLLVDCVSSMVGMPINFEEWGIDFALASCQKAFALPPGVAVAVVSEKALERAEEVDNRGYYFDLVGFKESADKGQTPTTPSISHIYALDRQCDDMLAETMEVRFERHREMADIVRTWARENFELFPEPGYESDTVTCIKNTRGLSIARLNRELLERHDCVISNGYGKLKDQTFRIGHMGDLQPIDIIKLLDWIDEIIAEM